MHSSRELRSSSFEISAGGREVRLADLFGGFGEQDRLGVVIRSPYGGVGASALITATITAFYDLQRARGPDFFIYPDYFLFHMGRPLGDYARLDVWPAHKELVVSEEPEQILRAVNDRAITRLIVEEAEPGQPAYARETVASARRRIATCVAYSRSGRAHDADVRIASNPVSEGYVDDVLAPESRMAKLRAGDARQRAYAETIASPTGEFASAARAQIRLDRQNLVEDGRTVEAYRRIDLDEALGMLAAQPVD